MSKATELRNKTIEELNNELVSSLKEQFNLRMQNGTSQEVKPHLFKQVGRQIARLRTLINEKEKG